jgi:para-aminobenzoate synthetase component 1
VEKVASGPIRRPLELSPEQLARRIGTWPDPALLESGPGFGPAGRWSILAAEPRLVFESRGPDWSITPPIAIPRGLDPLAAMDWLIREILDSGPVGPPEEGRPPFQGGLIGYFGYDLAPSLERLPRRAAPDSRMPDVRFGLYDTFVAVDHAAGRAELWAADLLGEGPASQAARLDAWVRRLHTPTRPPSPSRLGPIRALTGREEYLASVRRALDYIAAGDIFQVNLSQRFEAQGHVDPLDLYLRLRRRSPSPFAAFLRWGDLAVVSASPEWFYETRGGRIVTRPIKGTRPRSADPAEDARLADELRRSPKDRAELTMIVDLERNDLGRVCEYGSIRVTEPLVVESFAQVHHLVATVEGRLRPGVGPVDVVRAVFPGGSITGAPKIRAMEIVDELEPTRRGLYTGAVGYIGPGGDSMFNIAIRTALVEGDTVRYQVGGGIVADSVPEAEYEETLHKGRGLREVIEGWGLPR